MKAITFVLGVSLLVFVGTLCFCLVATFTLAASLRVAGCLGLTIAMLFGISETLNWRERP